MILADFGRCGMGRGVTLGFPYSDLEVLHPGKLPWNPKSWRFGSDDFSFQCR